MIDNHIMIHGPLPCASQSDVGFDRSFILLGVTMWDHFGCLLITLFTEIEHSKRMSCNSHIHPKDIKCSLLSSEI
jgi:hypothetical protein